MPTPPSSDPCSAPLSPERGLEGDTQEALRRAMRENDDLRATNQALHDRVQRLVSRLQEVNGQRGDIEN
jgi:hypothetical protein